MKIIVKNNTSERQSPEVTIDTSTCQYPYAIREALQLALELDGYTKETINEVFGRTPVVCKQDTRGQAEPAQERFTNDEGGYARAMTWLDAIGKLDEINDQCETMTDVIKKANELWEQDNPKQNNQ